jgi:hypothetical protein
MRRNSVGAREAQYVAGLAGVSGVLTAISGLRPTGSVVVDVLLVAIAAGAVTWAAATTPWWLIATAALVAAGTAPNVVWVVVGLAAVVMACVIGAGQQNLPVVRSLAVLITIEVLTRCEVTVFLGCSALFACGVLAAVFVWGVVRRPRQVRRRVWRGLAWLGVAVAMAVLGFVLGGVAARGPLAEGNRQAHTGLSALNRGDTAAAASAFRASARAFRQADGALGAPWTQGARLVPFVAQQRDSVADLAAGAADAMAAAASAMERLDLDAISVVDGSIDIGAVRGLQQPFSELVSAIDDMQSVVDDARSPWLVGPLQRRLDKLAVDLTSDRFRADNALTAVQLAPRMLGAEGTRRYFVAFTTPAEARGLGGFMGNWALLTATNGKIEMTEFGRHDDLNRAGDPSTRHLTGLDEFVQQWGRFGFAVPPDGLADAEVWSNLTMAPDFPSVAEVVSQLYPQSGGDPIDGVFLLDPQAMAALISFTGPIQVEGLAEPLTAENAAQFIIKDQYLIEAFDQRTDLLERIARTTVDELLAGALPSPVELARQFAPLAAQGRFMAWSAAADEEELFRHVKVDGAFPRLNGADGVAVTVDNASANKIDAYLDVTIDQAVVAQTAAGQRAERITVTLTNNAPAEGLPRYVIGNEVNLPWGTNRTWLSVYTALPMSAVEIDGEPSGMQTASVFGWNVASKFIDIPPGATVTVVLTVTGTLADPTAPLVRRTQPLTVPPLLTSDLIPDT